MATAAMDIAFVPVPVEIGENLKLINKKDKMKSMFDLSATLAAESILLLLHPPLHQDPHLAQPVN